MVSTSANSAPSSRHAAARRSTERHAHRAFRRRLTATIAGLALLCAGLVVLDHFQGPKLQGAQIDTARAVTQPNQQLRLFVNEAVAQVQPGQVSVTPSTEFTTTTTAGVISVQFRSRLFSGTRYTVAIDGVTSRYDRQTGHVAYSFTTDAARVLYLDRADPAVPGEPNDSIIRTGVTGDNRQVLYHARHIQSFVHFSDVLAATIVNDDHTSSLVLVGISDGLVENIVLPGPGAVTQLAVSEGGELGFVFSSAPPTSPPTSPPSSQPGAAAGTAPLRYDKALLTMNLSGSHIAQPALGLTNLPISTQAWVFVPEGITAAVLTSDQSLILISPGTKIAPTPLGQYTGLMSAALDGRHLVVSDPFGPVSLELASGQVTRLPPNQLLGVTPYGGAVQLVGPEQRRIQEVVILHSTTGLFTGYLVLESGTASTILYQNADQFGNIERFSVSPNGQYLAVSVVPDVAASVSDAYFAAPESTSVTTFIVDIANRKIVRTLAGFSVTW